MIRSLLLSGTFALFSLTATADTAEPDVNDMPARWSPTDGAVIAFDVFRKGNEFGTHILTFDREDDDTFTVVSDVDLRAGLGPITVFRYSLDSTEQWDGGRLVSLSGKTNDDGKKLTVEGSAREDAFLVDGSVYEGTAPADIIPSSHWNIQQMYSDIMLSTESGELLDIDVTIVGEETVRVDGVDVPATRYKLKSDLDVDLWYDGEGRWVKLAFQVRDQEIEYRLRALYE